MTAPHDKHIEAARRASREHEWTPGRVDGAFQELVSRRSREDAFRRRALTFGGGALALSAALVLVIVGWRSTRPGAAPSTAEATVGAPALERLVIGEGTEVRFPRTTRIELKERTETRVLVSLERGAAHFQVRHDPRRLFRVKAGEVEIEDLGTTFDVENSGTGVRVVVTEGSVAVSFPRGGAGGRARAVLGPGESGVYALPAAPAAAPASPAVAATEEAPKTANAAPASSGWRELARGGKHGRAYELLAPGGFRDVRDEPGDLLLAADAARLSRHPAEAAGLLRRLLSGHAKDPRAPSAAFTLGWLLMNELGRPREAASAFARAEALAPRGNLAEDAVARSVEAWHRAGDLARAKAEVERYRKSYPGGRHLAMLERLVGSRDR